MVGDRAHDVKGALANAVFPVGALWGYGAHAELSAAGATMTVNPIVGNSITFPTFDNWEGTCCLCLCLLFVWRCVVVFCVVYCKRCVAFHVA